MSATPATKPARTPSGPVLKVTDYDRAAAFVTAAAFATGLTALLLFAAWYSLHEWGAAEPAVPLELVAGSGGIETGSESETLDLKTPYEETADPSLAEIRDDKTQVAPMLDAVVDFAGKAADAAREQSGTDAVNAGTPGSKSGTGRRALGLGPGDGGMPREQRWFVRFSEGGTTYTYARELDGIGIELGALLPGGKLVYVSKLSADKPTVRYANSGAGENRLYFTWQGGGRRTADIELFRKAGIDVGAAPIFHFYPKPAEEMLAKLEVEYRNRPTRDIRRTYFAVEPKGTGFKFVVTRQAYFR
jgi:hypothetical protein